MNVLNNSELSNIENEYQANLKILLDSNHSSLHFQTRLTRFGAPNDNFEHFPATFKNESNDYSKQNSETLPTINNDNVLQISQNHCFAECNGKVKEAVEYFHKVLSRNELSELKLNQTKTDENTAPIFSENISETLTSSVNLKRETSQHNVHEMDKSTSSKGIFDWESQEIKTETCFTCNSIVYPIDRAASDYHVYHKICLRCCVCKRSVSNTTCETAKDLVFCKPHFLERVHGIFRLSPEDSFGDRNSHFQNFES